MSILSDSVRDDVQKLFSTLKDPVTLVVFTRDDTIAVPGHECPSCRENDLLIKEVASLSEKISVEYHDYLKETELAKKHNIIGVPATLVQNKKETGIRLYGIPAGHEFTTLLSAIQTVSQGDSELSDDSKEKLNSLSKSIHIQVFVTLSCPYCAPTASLAHKIAFQNDNIMADIINTQEFPELAQQYGVSTVPKIIINETIQFEGAVSEEIFVERVIAAAGE